MKKKAFFLTFVFSLLAVLSFMSYQNVETAEALSLTGYEERVDFGAKFEPKGNRILHGAGQDQSGNTVTFDNYVNAIGDKYTPSISMGYVAPHHDYETWTSTYKASIAKYAADGKCIALQVGVTFNEDENPDRTYCDKIVSGEVDEQLVGLINQLKSFDVPVYCRPGFEFNGEWNGYTDAELYKQAFIRFATLVNRCGAENIALVWCMNPDGAEKDFAKYYPGDEYVDWFAFDLFRIDSAFDAVTNNFLQMANEHRKPVMISEATPFTYNVSDYKTWSGWFKKYFKFIKENPVIKATCYINWNWAEYPQWSNWGDARMEHAASYVKTMYKAEIKKNVFVHAQAKDSFLNILYGTEGV